MYIKASHYQRFATDDSIYDNVAFRAILLITITIIGAITNLLSAIVFLTGLEFRDPFGLYQGALCLGNFISCVSIFTWMCINAFVSIETANSLYFLNELLSQISLSFFEFGALCTLASAVSRAIAFIYPIQYSSETSYRNAKIIVIIALFFDTAYGLAYFWPGCSFHVNIFTLFYEFADTPCTEFLRVNIDFILSIIVYFITGLFNLYNLFRLREFKKNAEYSDKKKTQETVLYIQITVQFAIDIMYVTFYHIIGQLSTSNWQLFLSSTLIWVLTICSQGVSSFIINSEVRKRFLVSCGRNSVSSSSESGY